MSVIEMQTCLSRLYVDGPLRRLLVLEPSAVLDEYELTEAERASILAIPAVQFERMGRSLRLKRQHMVEASFPRLTGLKNPAVQRLARRYFESTVLEAGQSAEDDALRYGRYMEFALRERPELREALDEAEYETARLRVHCAAQTGASGPRMVEHAAVLHLSRNPNSQEEGPCTLIVLGQPEAAPLEFESDDITARLLSHCDGTTPPEAIAAREVAKGYAEDPQDVLDALEDLRASGILK